MQARTTLNDVLTHVRELELKAETRKVELAAHGKTLEWGSSAERWNYEEQRAVAGELLGLARVMGYLEARIQIDEIWFGKSTREIIDPLYKNTVTPEQA